MRACVSSVRTVARKRSGCEEKGMELRGGLQPRFMLTQPLEVEPWEWRGRGRGRETVVVLEREL